MSANSQRALIPIKKLSPPAVIEKNRDLAPLDLVNGNISLQSREEVKKLLPDIIGKALARIWIDPDFHKDFSSTLSLISSAFSSPRAAPTVNHL